MDAKSASDVSAKLGRYSILLGCIKGVEAHKVEDHVPIFRESIQVRSPESSALGFPAKKFMADAKGCKPSPNITMDSTLYDLI